MVTFKERCPVCNNILDEDDRCPTCTRGSIVESLPITLDSKLKHLSAIDLNIRIELTDAALRNLHDLGYGSPRATLSQYIANEIYAYIYNEGTGREGEPKIRVCLATDVGHKVNQSINEEIKGTLQFIGVIKENKFYTRNDFDSEKYLLILSVSKAPITNGWYVKDKCLFVRLTKTGNNHNVYNTIQKIIALPNIENLRDKVEKQLEQWNVYLEILNRNVKSKKYEVVYNALRQLDKNKVVFYITGNDIPWSSIRNSIEWPIKLRYSRALTNLGYDEDYEGDPEIGVVWEVEPSKNSITVELYSPSLFSVLPSSGVLYYDARADQIQIKRMQEGMTVLAKGKTVNPELAKFLFDISRASPITELVPLRKSEIYIREIFQNKPQMRAVRGALSARDIFLIQGPPGTGKTTIISEICYQLTRNGNRVLIASQSNLAVDNALSHLVKAPEIRAIRLGRAERVEEEGLEFLEENVVRRWLSDTRTLVANKQSYELQAIKQYQRDIDILRDEINTIEEYLSLEQDQNEKENELEKYKKSREPLDNVIETIKKILGAASEPEQYFEKISTGLDVLPAGLKREIESWVKSQAGFGQAIDLLGASLNAKDIFQKLAKFSNLSYDNLVDNIIKPLKWMLLTKKIALIDTYLEDLGRVRRAIDEKIQIPIVSRVIFDDVREFGTDLEMEITECVDVKKHLLEKQASLSISEEVSESSIEKVFLKVNKYLDTCRWLESLIAKIPELNRVLEGTLKKEKEKLEKIEKPLQSLEFEINQIHLKRSALKNKIEEWGLEPTQEELDGLREDLSIMKTNYEKIKNREYRRRYIESWLERLSNLTNTDIEDLRQIYVDNANVVGVTCSAAGSRRFMEKYHGFDCVIIDEVSKAIPPEIVLPSIKGRKIILVGDHRQLPPLIE
ncbi:MAG: AAA domain-containing protein, partial [Candidatus Methanomethylicaceae archaeon]